MTFCGTISRTFGMVGANGLGGFTGFGFSRILCVSVAGNVLILAIPLSGGRVGDNSPSSRRASHSMNVGNSMRICSRPRQQKRTGEVAI